MPAMPINRAELTEEEAQLLANSDSKCLEDQEWFKGCRVYYTLPFLRLTTFNNVVLICDIIATGVLWIIGKYLYKDHFIGFSLICKLVL